MYVSKANAASGAEQVRAALATAPRRFAVFDRDGALALDLGGDSVQFDPGSAALWVLDPVTGRRKPETADLARLAWVTEGCKPRLAGQSTGLVAPTCRRRWATAGASTWRLNSRKPVITGTFRKDAFAVMKGMLAAARGGEAALAEHPLAIFDCCPTPPLVERPDLPGARRLRQERHSCRARVNAARRRDRAGHSEGDGGAALRESLSGVLIHQLAHPGAPIVFGGSPSAFDMRRHADGCRRDHDGRHRLRPGRQAPRASHPRIHGPRDDAKGVDYQAGFECGLGAVLAALAGINMVSGPGMLDFESCQSLEKLVLDNEACGMALRMVQGISHDSAGEAVELLRQVVESGSLLGHPHTRTHFRAELLDPRRGHRQCLVAGDWEKAGSRDSRAAAAAEVQRILSRGDPAPAPDDLRRELDSLIRADAQRLGVQALPPPTA